MEHRLFLFSKLSLKTCYKWFIDARVLKICSENMINDLSPNLLVEHKNHIFKKHIIAIVILSNDLFERKSYNN